MSDRVSDRTVAALADGTRSIVFIRELRALAVEVQVSRKLIADLRAECAGASLGRDNSGTIWAFAIVRMIDEAEL